MPKLTFGLVLYEFKDSVKEGDGPLISTNLPYYFTRTIAIISMLFSSLVLVKCIAILPPSQAEPYLQCQWPPRTKYCPRLAKGA